MSAETTRENLHNCTHQTQTTISELFLLATSTLTPINSRAFLLHCMQQGRHIWHIYSPTRTPTSHWKSEKCFITDTFTLIYGNEAFQEHLRTTARWCDWGWLQTGSSPLGWSPLSLSMLQCVSLLSPTNGIILTLFGWRSYCCIAYMWCHAMLCTWPWHVLSFYYKNFINIFK